MTRILLSWSSGKDSAWALYVLKQQREYEIAGLLTTFNRAANRVAMHAVRRELVEAQAEEAGIPLWRVELPWPCCNADYEAAMRAACRKAVAEGMQAVAFGDLFLEDVRAYREKQMRDTGLQPLFPIWGLPTTELARQMVAAGLRAKLTCIDPKVLDASFAGREFDASLLQDLPAEVDACGERGEFHSFAYAGPMFQRQIEVATGEVVTRDGLVFADVMLREARTSVET